MKSKFLLFAFLGIVVFYTACTSKDSVLEETTLNGTWKLKNVSGGLADINIDYNEGDVYWTFNTKNGKLEVINNIETTGPEDIYAIFDTGTYNFTVSTEATEDVLYVSGEKIGVITISKDKLLLDQGVPVDGVLTEFVR